MKDKHYASVDELIAEIAGMSIEELASEPWDGPHLITVDELRAAGALDVPPAWRKSLGGERDLLPLFGDDDAGAEQQPPMRIDAEDDVPADELR